MITKNQALYLRTIKEINDLREGSFVYFINKDEYKLNLIKLDILKNNKERLEYLMTFNEFLEAKHIAYKSFF